MITKVAVDSSHPSVQKLVNAGFSEAESITAIEKWETPEDAVGYLIAIRAQNVTSESAIRNETNRDAEEDKTLQYVTKVIL